MRIWIDLANSPHPLLFAPVARRLQSDGHHVLVTARDNAQTVELARERWPDATIIGGESPAGRKAKALAILARMRDLRRWAGEHRPDVALSHNSYAQIVAARSRRIPVVTAMDFEHQPSNHLAFRLANRVLLPEVMPQDLVRRQGAAATKVTTYPGLKEELYIGDFEPDERILEKLGLSPRPRTVAVLRTPPSRAVYHSFGNPMFEAALRRICAQPHTACVVLCRHAEQLDAIRKLGLDNCIVPDHAVDARSLVYAADAMVGAGGTMTREAALMGIPTWTAFAGRAPAVDTWLERQGRLSRLERADQLDVLEPRDADPVPPAQLRERSAVIEAVVLQAIADATSRRAAVARA
ncbi:MAG: DUF354 domain-containing protein [Solirubrobacterales bacterium]|nr:DUF354 domain-containing protein [Solirubrobacterales bacterium]